MEHTLAVVGDDNLDFGSKHVDVCLDYWRELAIG